MVERKPRLLRGALPASASEATKEEPAGVYSEFKASSTALPWKKFLLVWSVSFFAFFMGLALAGLAPQGAKEMASFVTSPLALPFQVEPLKAETDESVTLVPEIADQISSDPEIMAPAIGLRSKIVSPQNRDLNILNTALAKGVVHYPGSASPGEVGNVFLFGHSTGLPVVHNKAYEVFNRLKELRAGDAIRIRENNREYLYLVSSIAVKKADDARIDLESSEKKLTLSTCKIFGGKEDRYIVEAEFVRSYPLRSL